MNVLARFLTYMSERPYYFFTEVFGTNTFKIVIVPRDARVHSIIDAICRMPPMEQIWYRSSRAKALNPSRYDLWLWMHALTLGSFGCVRLGAEQFKTKEPDFTTQASAVAREMFKGGFYGGIVGYGIGLFPPITYPLVYLHWKQNSEQQNGEK